MKSTDNIILVGPMGCGKSTIGRKLANRLCRTFYDSDREIEERTGVGIPLIFDIEGEEGFRSREAAMITELCQQEQMVLATGGGVVLSAENRRHLSECGTVIYLCAPLDMLHLRTRRDRNRPLLQSCDQKQKLKEILLKRDPLYRQVADIIIETRQRSVSYVVKEIIGKLKIHERSERQSG